MINDLRFALRMLLKSPAFAAVAVLSLALGIGACTTVFCWIQSALLRPFPGVAQPERLVVLCAERRGELFDTVSLPDLRDFRKASGTFAGVLGSQITPACLTVNGKSEWIYGQIATANFFDVLGVKPALGRAFVAEEDLRPGGAPVLVLSHGFWQRRFGGDPGIVGRTVELNRHSFTVVGVAPAGFLGTMNPLNCDFWAPLSMHQQVAHFGSLTERGDRWLHTIARLQPGVRFEQAQAAATTIARQLEASFPVPNREIGVRILRPWKSPWGAQALLLPVLPMLLAVSLGVLLIVAANVANLLLARASIRQKEVAIRLAMGAGWGRLVRQFLTESLLLGALGGLLGIVVAHYAANAMAALIPDTYLPVTFHFPIDRLTLGFTLLVTLATVVLFGLAPALQAARANLQTALKEGGRTSSAGGSHQRFRGLLVATEIALALLLLVGAGLCIKGSGAARRIDPGFDPRQAVVAGLRLGAHGYSEQDGKVFYRRLREQLAAQPGVQAAALASWFPLGFEGGGGTSFEVAGYQPTANENMGAQYAIVTPGYFESMGIPFVDGRDFAELDAADAPRAVILNETMAKRYWPDQSPLGREMKVWGGQTAKVIGVVKAGKYRSLSEPDRPFLYLSYQQGVPDLNLGVILRTTVPPASVIPMIRREIHALDPAVEVWAALTLENFVEAAFVAQRIASTLLLVLGAVALALAAMGIYGAMAYAVSQRTQEMGVRLALGAQARDVIGLVLKQGLRLAALGGVMGCVGAVILTRLLRSFLHGVHPLDPGTFIGVLLLLTAVTGLACFIPAWKASRVSPVEALRYE